MSLFKNAKKKQSKHNDGDTSEWTIKWESDDFPIEIPDRDISFDLASSKDYTRIITIEWEGSNEMEG